MIFPKLENRLGNRLEKLGKVGTVVLTAALSLSLVVGCSRGPSQKELAALDEKQQAAESAEQMVAKKQAEKARLERKLSEKKAEKKARAEEKAGTEENLATLPNH